MDPTSSSERLDHQERSALIEVARASVSLGVSGAGRYKPRVEDYPPRLRQRRACFVTLRIDGRLRGCVGCLEPREGLVCEVAQAAHSAAFKDPRFAQVTEVELDALQFHISVLTPPVAMHFTDEQTLLSQLRPGIDGLVLRVGKHCGTFLPQVWESIPEPADFLRQLRLKAGLAPDHWSDSLIVERYQTESFGA